MKQYPVRQPLISIVIVFKQENPYLLESITNCFKLDYNNFEIVLLPDTGISHTFQTQINKLNKHIRKQKKRKTIKIKIIPTGNFNIPIKRNIGVKSASRTAEFIAFIDDDAFPKTDWLKNAIPFFSKKKIGAVGGPNLTPPKDPYIQRIAGNVMKSKLAMGKAYVRTRICSQQFINELPTCNLIVKNSLFKKIRFDENLVTGEDAKLCADIINQDLKIIYSPKVIVYHHRRKIFIPFMKQFFYYGLYKGKLYKRKQTLNLYYVIPSEFFLFVVYGFIASFLHPFIEAAYILILAFYFLIILLSAIRNSKFFEIPATWICIFLTQFSYGCGFTLGYLFK